MQDTTINAAVGARAWAGNCGVALVCFGFGASTAAISIGLGLAGLAAIADGRRIRRHWPGLTGTLVLAGTTTVIVIGVCFALANPADAARHLDATWELVRVAGLPGLALGWWLHQSTLPRRVLVAVFLAGGVFALPECLDWAVVAHAPFAGRRAIEVACQPNSVAFIAAPVLLCALAVMLRRGHTALAAVLGAFAAYVVITTQSRGALAALALAVVVLLAINLWRGQRQRAMVVTACLAVGVAAAAATPLADVVLERMEVVAGLDGGAVAPPVEQQSLTERSNRIRLALWGYALDAWWAAPLLGHGPGAVLLEGPQVPDIVRADGANHFHSIWLQWLATIGLVGTIGLGSAFLAVPVATLRLLPRQRDAYTLGAAVAMWVFLIVLTLIQLRYNHPAGKAAIWLAQGLSFAALFAAREGRDAWESAP